MTGPKARTFLDLIAWKKAHGVALALYQASQSLPPSETYGLRSQIRRAAVSVPANIAEGFKRRGRPDKLRFLNIAQASLEEVRYFLILARDLGFGKLFDVMPALEEASRVLEGYRSAISASSSAEY